MYNSYFGNEHGYKYAPGSLASSVSDDTANVAGRDRFFGSSSSSDNAAAAAAATAAPLEDDDDESVRLTMAPPPPPRVSPARAVSDGDKFNESPPYRDLLFAVAFVAHLALLVLLAGPLTVTGPSEPADDDLVPRANNTSAFRRLLLVSSLVAVAGGLFASAWLALVRRFARQLMVASLCASVAAWALLGIVLLARGGPWWLGVGMLLAAGGHLVVYFYWRARIPFAVAMLQTVAELIDQYPATAYVAYGSLFVQLLWVFVWTWLVSRVQFYDSGAQAVLVFFLVLSFYWTGQVIKNTVHVTASGVFASWYFMSTNGRVLPPERPTLLALKRATTTSFGSVCLGSLLVALLQTLRYLARGLRANRIGGTVARFVSGVAECLLGCVEGLVRYFNVYAFTQVAIYGKSYWRAARDTYALIESHGIEAIINDSLVGPLLSLGCLLGGLCGSLVASLLAWLLLPPYCWLPCAFVGFLICFAMVSQTMELVQSGVSTIFVCFAMDPDVLKQQSPGLFQLFASTYARR